jgi:hypothetical protein
MRTHTRSGRRRGPLRGAVLAGVAAAALVVGVSTASATPTTSAASWLAGQLTGGNHYVVGGSTDVGLTEDGLLAFVAAGSGYTSQVSAIAGWLDSTTNIGGGSALGYIGSSTVHYPGALANTSLAVIAAGDDPTNWAGGLNLISLLESTEATSGSDAGEFVDPRDSPTYQGYANPTGQALAVIAIEHADPTFTGLSSAVSFLRGQVCSAGGYPSEFGSANCPADPDTTAVVSQALSYAGGTVNNLAAESANSWLDSDQATQSVGTAWQNYCQSPYTSVDPSVDSTGLAVDALLTDPRGASTWSADVSAGQSWLGSTQNSDGGMPACTASGSSDVRATVQGVPGLAGLGYVALL